MKKQNMNRFIFCIVLTTLIMGYVGCSSGSGGSSDNVDKKTIGCE